MTELYINRNALLQWADPKTYELGKQMYESNSVDLELDEDRINGVIASSSTSIRTRFRLLNDGSVENQCPCRVSREQGRVCAHVVCIGFALADRYADPVRDRANRLQRMQTQHASGRSRFGSVLQPAPANAPRLAATVSLRLAPNGLVKPDSVALTAVIRYQQTQQRIDKLPRGLPLVFSETDSYLILFLEDIAGLPLPYPIELTCAQFAELLDLLAPSKLACPDRQESYAIEKDAAMPLLKVRYHPADRTANLRLIFDEQNMDQPRCFHTRHSAWIFTGQAFKPFEAPLPAELEDIYHGHLRIPGSQLYRFYHEVLPALDEVMLVDSDLTHHDLELTSADPDFKLDLDGGPENLAATLYALYGNECQIAGKQAQDPLAVPSPQNPYLFLSRNLDREKEALLLLQSFGFTPTSSQDALTLKGSDHIARFLMVHVNELRQQEWRIEAHRRIPELLDENQWLRPDIHIRSVNGATDWFSVQYDFSTAAGQSLSEEDIIQAMARGQAFLERNGKTILFDPKTLMDLHETLQRDAQAEQQAGQLRLAGNQAGFTMASLSALPGLHIQADQAWLDMAGAQNRRIEAEPVQLPASLDQVLRPYQKDGVNWLRFLERIGFHGILADDMGLGKTLQALAWIQLQRLRSDLTTIPNLIVCPSSLTENWAAEAAKFTPGLSTLVFTGTQRHKHWDRLNQVNLVITSYALLRRDIDRFHQRAFAIVILDEAQHIKNHSTQNARAAKAIQAHHRLVLTGTPIENSVADLWSIVDFLMPGYLGSQKAFQNRYQQPIESGAQEAQNACQRLHHKIHPLLLRRMKKEVAAELPPKINRVACCDMTRDQMLVYKKILEQGRRDILRAQPNEQRQARFNVLKVLLRLRQVCCDLRLLKWPDLESRYPSSKLNLFLELADEAMDSGHRVLVFSQFVSMLKIIKTTLEERDIPLCFLDGSTSNRLEIVDHFNQSDIPFFLISLKAGGTGLNLTGADMVIHYDPWWNPAVENQATDRAHRIGQTRSVYSIKLITRNSVEEKVQAIQQKKQLAFDTTLSNERGVISSLSWNEIHELLTL